MTYNEQQRIVDITLDTCPGVRDRVDRIYWGSVDPDLIYIINALKELAIGAEDKIERALEDQEAKLDLVRDRLEEISNEGYRFESIIEDVEGARAFIETQIEEITEELDKRDEGDS